MTGSNKILYLASQSPRRREILSRMRIPFQVAASRYQERLRQKAEPVWLALEHAEGKARKAQVPGKARYVMGADTVVACGGRILGKPRDEKAAVAMIQFLAGRRNEVITGIALLDRKTGILTRAAAHSVVSIKKMNLRQCQDYVRLSHPYDKAGGYAIQGKPRIAKRQKGSYSNIVGFPRELVRRLLKQAGFLSLAFYILSAAFAANPAAAAESQRVRSQHTEASLISEYTAAQPGKPLRVALRLKMDPRWHTYWVNSGDSGLATSLRWTLPEGFSAGPLQWPYPELIRQDPLATYGYHDEVWLFTTLQVPEDLRAGSTVTLRAKAEWLECEIPCLPGKADLALELAVAEDSRQSPEWRQKADLFLDRLPSPAPSGRLTFEQDESRLMLKGLPPAPEAYFFPYDGELFEHAAFQKLNSDGSETTLEIPRSGLRPGKAQNLEGVLLLTQGGKSSAYEVRLNESKETVSGETAASENKDSSVAVEEKEQSVPVPQTEISPNETERIQESSQSVARSKKPVSLVLALAFAFLGGLILNLMPCVLPVLSLKILGFVTERGKEKQLRAHGLVWSAGVLVSFWLLSGLMLALRWGGSSLGWGFHLQSPAMVAALAVIFLLLTLNLAGFFEVGLLLTRFSGGSAGQGTEKTGQAFAAGVLAVVAATPCTAPFMGAAVGYALTQPVPVVLAVFTFLGLGMASPFLLLAFAPGGLKFLPKPGPWMNTFKRMLALPLGLTVIWLFWVLQEQVEVSSLKWIAAALLAIALSAIFYGRAHLRSLAGDAGASKQSLFFLAVLVLSAALVIGIAGRNIRTQEESLSTQTPHSSVFQGVRWQVFSREAVWPLVEDGSPVFINFTARWCLSCQVNDRLVFQNPAVGEAFRARGVHAFKADWTSKDEMIAQVLADYGRASVPLYVFYDGKNKTPRLLPEILSVDFVLKVLEQD